MRLADLVSSLALLRQSGSLDREILGIAYDSREVRPGYLFVAIPGFHTDGHNYVQDAAARGAVAAIVSKDIPETDKITLLQVLDTRKALAELAKEFYQEPSAALRVVGVTGTNGKTTTTFLIDSILANYGQGVGIIGTVKVRVGTTTYPVTHTTPESLDLQRYLYLMRQASLQYAVMEVSSHALALERTVGCEYDVAVFTNLTQDHLDMHGDMESYFNAKGKLFSGLSIGKKQNKAAVINLDDPYGERMRQLSKVPVITYGLSSEADVSAQQIKFSPSGTEFELLIRGQRSGLILLATPGNFSVYNALAAIAVTLHEGVPLPQIIETLASVPGVPGRFQPVRHGQPFEIIVDYAHTPDSLKNILLTARSFSQGRVIVVFGCGGDRDRGKRPLMGEIAGELADLVILTSDNPRTEDPARILDDILSGISNRECVVVEVDRKRAIHLAIKMAQPGDVLLIAGKGHETYQVFKDQTIHFDDREVAEAALEALRDEGMETQGNSRIN